MFPYEGRESENLDQITQIRIRKVKANQISARPREGLAQNALSLDRNTTLLYKFLSLLLFLLTPFHDHGRSWGFFFLYITFSSWATCEQGELASTSLLHVVPSHAAAKGGFSEKHVSQIQNWVRGQVTTGTAIIHGDRLYKRAA